MPKMSFNTTEADAISVTEQYGQRKDTVLKSAFSSSPLLKPAEFGEIAPEGYSKGNLAPDKLKNWFFNNVVNGTVPKSGGYFGIQNDISMDYSGAPDLASVKSGGGAGEPATPFIPNLASPGAGSVNAVTQPALDPAVTTLLKNKNPATFGEGDDANQPGRNPSVTAVKIKAAVPSFDANGIPQDLGKSGAST